MVNLTIVSLLGAAAACLVLGAFAANSHAQTTSVAGTTQPAPVPRIHLWANTLNVVEGKDTDTDPTVPTLDIYLPPEPNGAAVLVLPGGGYTHLATGHEGKDVATFLNGHHVTAFVLRYRHAPRYHNPIPLEDAQRAMRIVRRNAAEYRIDPKRIGVIGFSAGGHLAATLATAPENPDAAATSADPIDRISAHPDFAALIYPVITFTDERYVHKGSRTALAGNDRTLWSELSAENRVTANTPPVFLAHAGPDKTVPVENSILFFEACHRNHVPAELHIFPTGGHGFGMTKDPALSIWTDLLIHWMSSSNWFSPQPPPAAATKPG
ncbi:MAG TPA: alpha/beta hydrolase [Phycisphaerae bacterium]|nr:alpha/beta hydrolase [Phycisphaerae bacterium]